MGWATPYITKLQRGETVSFRPRGNSMIGRISSGQKVTVRPLGSDEGLKKRDIVLCTVSGAQYLHLVTAVQPGRVQISNNHGKVNGWTPIKNIYGKCIRVEP